MKSITEDLAAHLAGENTTLCRLWKITRKTTGVAVVQPSIAVSPPTATIAPSGTQQFTATVSGTVTTNTVVWSVDGVPGGNAIVGTIDATGLYTAPATAGSHSVKAALSYDPTLFGTATLTVSS